MTIALELLRRFWPYLVVAAFAGALSFSAAWNIQGMRLTAAEQEFTQYKQDQAEAILAQAAVANRMREEAAHEYKKVRSKLDAEIAAGEVYRRCVAAGRCGGLSVQSTSPGIRLSPASGTDDPRPDAVPPTPGAAEVVPVVADCAATTLMLNSLQADIERQVGY